MTRKLIVEILGAFGRSFGDDRIDRLVEYFNVLFFWNRRVNLTGIRDEGEAIRKHLCDSLAVLEHIKPGKILDIGTGAGIPGLILKIVNPDLDVYLVEASRKKVSFLSYVTSSLGLQDVKVINERLDPNVPSGLLLNHSPFDTILSQAVGDIQYIYRLGRFYADRNSIMVLMKGKGVNEEIEKIRGNIDGKVAFRWVNVPVLGVERCFVVISEVGGLG